MQNTSILNQEIDELASRFPGSSVKGIWNQDDPLAACVGVELNPFPFPDEVSSEACWGVIPIPDYYGFAISANIVLFPREILCEGKSIPFCEPANKSVIRPTKELFPMLRRFPDALLGTWSICIMDYSTPSGRFEHFGLGSLMTVLIKYLRTPYQINDEAISQLLISLRTGEGQPIDYLTLSHIYSGIGDEPLAKKTILDGLEHYPGHPWLLGRWEDT